MQRYIITYLTLLKQRGVIVVETKTKRRAATKALSILFADGVFEILKVRELYNPIADTRTVSTNYEISQYNYGIYDAIEDLDAIPEDKRNRIAQFYETGF